MDLDLTHLPYIALGAFALLSVALLIWRGRAEATRRKELEKLSYGLGFDYTAEDDSLLEDEELRELPLLSRGRRRRVRNVLRRAEGDVRLTLFDFRYTTGSGRNSSTHHQTVLLARLDSQSLPKLELRPENLLHRIGSALGFQDIDFEGFPEFSRRYLLRGEDEEAVRQVFGPSLLQTLERHPGWCVEANRASVLLYRRGRVKPAELQSFSTTAQEILRALVGR